ncbi:MAG: hypothetical protein FWC24_06990 [Treponema sp.]|nr:hypothetical protein [Treponema sp.]
MKKFGFLVLIACLVFAACNTPLEDTVTGTAEEIILEVGGIYNVFSGDGYAGAEINLIDLLNGKSILDISNYDHVTVDATLYADDTGEILATEPIGSNKNLAQFTLLIDTGNWPVSWPNQRGNACGPTKYGMAINGLTTWYVTTDAGGIPSRLLLQVNWTDFPDEVKSIRVRSITFVPKSAGDENNVILDWGSGAKTDLFPTDTLWPGKSLPLDGASTIIGELSDITLYKEVIVTAVVYDRNNTPVSPTVTLNNTAFFTLTTAEGQWQETEIVKQYDMIVDGDTSVTPETNKRELGGTPTWGPGIPTHIVFQGKYESSKANNEMAGYVLLQKITFIAK